MVFKALSIRQQQLQPREAMYQLTEEEIAAIEEKLEELGQKLIDGFICRMT